MIPDHVVNKEQACRGAIADLNAEIKQLHERMIRALTDQAASTYDLIAEREISRHFGRQIDERRAHLRHLETMIPPHTIWREDLGCYERVPVAT